MVFLNDVSPRFVDDSSQSFQCTCLRARALLCVARCRRILKSDFPRKILAMKSFQFTVCREENGYRVRVRQGEDEFVWPEVFSTLEKAGKEIWEALTNASQSRGEI
jgi:hypothetical protein